jgi:hypothetical protein
MTTTGARFLSLASDVTSPRPRGLQSRIALWVRAVANHQEQQMIASADRLAAREDKIDA